MPGMGMGIFSSFSSFDEPVVRGQQATTAAPVLPNPRPDNYEIIKWKNVNGNLVIRLRYPDCDNYEGHKILVYQGLRFKELLAQKLIDPHFSKNPKYYSPVARFVPTGAGWEMALALAKSLLPFTWT